MLVFRLQDLEFQMSRKFNGDTTIAIASPITDPMKILDSNCGTTLKMTIIETKVKATAANGASEVSFLDAVEASSRLIVTRSTSCCKKDASCSATGACSEIKAR